MPAKPRKQFTGLIPILCVTNFRRSMTYYTRKLGFRKMWDWGKPPGFGCVARDGIQIFFCQDGQGLPGTWLYIDVRDVGALHKELRKRKADILGPPEDKPWGMRELLVRDPDGHTFRFGQHLPE